MKFLMIIISYLFLIAGCSGGSGGGSGGGNVAPSLDFTSSNIIDAIVPTTSPAIQYRSFDPDDIATITFYVDTDPVGFDGIAIGSAPEQDGNATFFWTRNFVTEGIHFIYATVDDGVNPIVTSAYRDAPIIAHIGEAPAYATIIDPPIRASAVVIIDYDIWSVGGPLNIFVEYRGGSVGPTWTPATTSGLTTGLSSGPAWINWESEIDESGITAADYQVRISVQNAGSGLIGPWGESPVFSAAN